MATNSVRESSGRMERIISEPLSNAIPLHRRAFVQKAAACLAVMGGSLAVLKGPDAYRQYTLQQNIEYLYGALVDDAVTLSQYEVQGARDIILLAPLPVSHDVATFQEGANMRLTWLQEAIKKGYASAPTILLRTGQNDHVLANMHYESIDTFAWHAARAYEIPHRSAEEPHVKEKRAFDAIEATAQERRAKNGFSIPAVLAYQPDGTPEESVPTILWQWNRERINKGERPLQIMELHFGRSFSRKRHAEGKSLTHVLTE